MTADRQVELEETTDSWEKLYATGDGQTFTGDDAVRWGQDALHSTYWSMQEDIIRSTFDNRKTAVRSCNSAGKTYVASDIALAFLLNMAPAKVITTAPTFRQVRDVLWAEIRTKYNNYLFDEMNGIECQQTRLELAPGWFMLGTSPDKGVSFQGFHQTHVLVLFDEAPGVKPEVVRGAETLMASGNVHTLWIGNPLASSGHFYNAFRGGGWNTIHISYEMTPNFTGEELPEKIKAELISPQWIAEMAAEWGENHPYYLSSCLGEFPVDDGRAIIPLKLCMDAVARTIEPEGEMVLGVDVGAGGDLTAYCRRRGQVILDVTTQSTPEAPDVQQRVLEMHQRDHYTLINIDSCGIGWGVETNLRALGLPIKGINAGGKGKGQNDPEHYFNRRAELWFGGRDWLKYGKIPKDDQLIADLTAPIQLNLSGLGQQRVESKQDTKKRLKARSPDRGDAFLLAIQGESAPGLGIYFL